MPRILIKVIAFETGKKFVIASKDMTTECSSTGYNFCLVLQYEIRDFDICLHYLTTMTSPSSITRSKLSDFKTLPYHNDLILKIFTQCGERGTADCEQVSKILS